MNIIQRLNIFMESTGLTVSQFADKLAVPRPSMSQLLNGRNKKVSNEIIEKLHAVFLLSTSRGFFLAREIWRTPQILNSHRLKRR